jgi:hypothetical protein
MCTGESSEIAKQSDNLAELKIDLVIQANGRP